MPVFRGSRHIVKMLPSPLTPIKANMQNGLASAGLAPALMFWCSLLRGNDQIQPRAEEPSCRKWGIDLLSCLPPPLSITPPPARQMYYSTFASFNKLHFSPILHLQLWYSLFCLGILPSNCSQGPVLSEKLHPAIQHFIAYSNSIQYKCQG